jgi:phosphatidylglycerol:prolipoprotein diacylglycerol transferase
LVAVLAGWIYHHDLDPFIIRFTEGIGLRWYGLAYVLGFLAGYWLLTNYLVGKRVQLTNEEAGDFVLTVALAGVVGGRFGYVFLYGMEYFLRDPFYLFAVWEGGMSIHGGVVGAVLGIVWFARSYEVSFWKLSDAAAFGTPPGLFFGRIANFINGELWGRPTGGDWGVVFPAADNLPRHPSQLYEAVLEGPVLFGLLVLIMRYTDEDGYTSGGFLVGYGVLRFLVEFYRAPDPHIGYEILGMTRGQEYSILFMFLGILLLPPIRRVFFGSRREVR